MSVDLSLTVSLPVMAAGITNRIPTPCEMLLPTGESTSSDLMLANDDEIRSTNLKNSDQTGSDSGEESGYQSCTSTEQKSMKDPREIDQTFTDIMDVLSVDEFLTNDSPRCIIKSNVITVADEIHKLSTVDGGKEPTEVGTTLNDFESRPTPDVGITLNDFESRPTPDVGTTLNDFESRPTPDIPRLSLDYSDSEAEDNSNTNDTSVVDTTTCNDLHRVDVSEDDHVEVEEAIDDVSVNDEDCSEGDEEGEDDAEDGNETDGQDEYVKDKHVLEMDPGESDGGWITEDEAEVVAMECDVDSNNSCDGPQIPVDFFDVGSDVDHPLAEHNVNVNSYPSKQYFYRQRSRDMGRVSSRAYSEDSAEDEFAFTSNFNLNTGRKYAFPRREPRTINEAVQFWETDFEVEGSVYPKMAVWEDKGLAPQEYGDDKGHQKFMMYKSLHYNWVNCNRSTDQWYRKFWGRSLTEIAFSKFISKKRRLVATSEDDLSHLPDVPITT